MNAWGIFENRVRCDLEFGRYLKTEKRRENLRVTKLKHMFRNGKQNKWEER